MDLLSVIVILKKIEHIVRIIVQKTNFFKMVNDRVFERKCEMFIRRCMSAYYPFLFPLLLPLECLSSFVSSSSFHHGKAIDPSEESGRLRARIVLFE